MPGRQLLSPRLENFSVQINVEIFSQGEELLIGQTIDTNSAWLSEQLVALGFKVRRHTAVGDDLPDLINLLKEIAVRADCCLCTGGLGPTSDDLTAEAVAQAFNVSLEFDSNAFAQIADFFARRKRSMPEINRKQAMLPTGALRIDNLWGTAPGFALRYQECWFVFMPGVPFEMRNMFAATVKPLLETNYALQPHQHIAIKTIGIGESAIQERIKDIVIPDNVKLGFCAGEDDVKTKLDFPADYPPPAKQQLIDRLAYQLGDFVFAIDTFGAFNTSLVDVINTLLCHTKQTLAVIETVSQGLIAAKCVTQPWLLQSCYIGSYAQLENLYAINLTTDFIANTKKLAELERQRSQADIVLLQLFHSESIQTSANEQTLELYNVLLTAQGYFTQSIPLGGSPRRTQNQSALLALDFLRRYLQQNIK